MLITLEERLVLRTMVWILEFGQPYSTETFAIFALGPMAERSKLETRTCCLRLISVAGA